MRSLVFAVRPPQGVAADCVLVDDFGGAYTLTRQLITQGHRKIGYIGNPLAVYTGAERFRGYSAAMHEAGLQVKRTLVERVATDAATAR
jgi:LacI family transcriptional regulator